MANGEHGGNDGGSLPKHTTPTWEVELLISGVAVFAMLQLPGLLDDAIFALRPRFSAEWSAMAAIIYIYAKSAAVLLATTFVVHLLLRARWIALVGMHSIYPQGIDWARLRLGPHARRAEMERLGSVPEAIERADNRATIVFSFGVTITLLLLGVTLGVVLALGAAMAAGVPPQPEILFAAVACIVVPFALLQVIDRRYGDRMPEDGIPSRILRAVLRAYAAVGFGSARNVVFALLASNGGRRRLVLATGTTLFVATAAVSIAYFEMREPGIAGSYAAFPADGNLFPVGVGTEHYADRRNAARDGEVPFIPSPESRGPYLEVMVPFRPALDEPAMQRECRDIRGLAGVRRISAELACLSRIHALRIDGRPVDLAFETSSDPATDRPALLAMVDVRHLGPGRHELRTARLDAHEDEPKDYVIPFWR